MIGWVGRALLILVGAVTGWFVAEDASNVVQWMVGLIFVGLVVFALAFWPDRWKGDA